MKIEQPIIIKILYIKEEAEDIKTFYFDYKLKAEPGNFVMLWIPNENEKPFGISFQDKNSFGCTIAKVGPFTKKLFELKKGDSIGFRGVFGKPFDIKGKNIVLVAGGYGAGPLRFLAERAIQENTKVNLIAGARNKELLLYKNQIFENITLHHTTDDGSFGMKGFTTQKLKELLDKDDSIDMIYTVGPEVMMKKVMEISDEYNIDCQLSIERYMKCGYGICGSCCVDNLGIRMCVEGPCIDKKLVKQITEFGKYHRDASGQKHYF